MVPGYVERAEVRNGAREPRGPRRKGLRLLLQLIDLGSEDEVVLGEAVGGVGPDHDADFAPFDVEVWVVALTLGDARDLVNKVDGWHEAVELEGLLDARLAPPRFLDLPPLDLLQEALCVGIGEGGRIA